jgi:hypothetical protein
VRPNVARPAPAQSDRALDAREALTAAYAIDDSRIDAASGAFRSLHTRTSSSTWREALGALEGLAEALVTIERAQVDHDAISLLLPHLGLAKLAEAGIRRRHHKTTGDTE